MSKDYTPEFKKKIVRLHMEEGRTYKSITPEYGVSKASTSKAFIEFCESVHMTQSMSKAGYPHTTMRQWRGT